MILVHVIISSLLYCRHVMGYLLRSLLTFLGNIEYHSRWQRFRRVDNRPFKEEKFHRHFLLASELKDILGGSTTGDYTHLIWTSSGSANSLECFDKSDIQCMNG